MNLNLNLGAGALDIPIARKLDISDASERSLQAPVRPAQGPLGPLRAMHQSSLDRRHDGTTAVRMERWNPDGALESGWSAGRARWDDGMILAPGSPDGPSGCRSGPLGQASGVGQPTRSLGRLAGP